MTKRKFDFMSLYVEDDGDCYVIDKDKCPNKDDVLRYICDNDCLTYDDRVGKMEQDIHDGWCRYGVVYDDDGDRTWGYQATLFKSDTMRNGKKMRGWFPVWIVRKGEWY